uniref:CKLF-like MARVEL transmembrane domain containing 8b n=1 Tax=Amphiprion percula TaxID=161767 RepID=A0A3P8TP21_AMPPE
GWRPPPSTDLTVNTVDTHLRETLPKISRLLGRGLSDIMIYWNFNLPLLLLLQVFGMLVWILIGGTDYFPLSALCWVMFVAILFWILTVSLCFHCSATVLYLVTAAVDALSVNQATRGRHNYNCWAASAFFAFLTTLCYAGSSYLSYRGWKISREEQ